MIATILVIFSIVGLLAAVYMDRRNWEDHQRERARHLIITIKKQD